MSGKRKDKGGEIFGHSRLRQACFVIFPDQQLEQD
jgi:hypothetical protein